MNKIYESLIPLIEKKSAITDPEKFQALVNVVFHDFEAAYYDELHKEMWESLPYQYSLLANDTNTHIKGRSKLKLLDVGCGTGLATELLLKTTLGNHISEIHLLDTSVQMLTYALKRANGWSKNVKIINGYISDINEQYDIIIISSVLHHIPDLTGFLVDVNLSQKLGGVLITIHDPNSGSLESDIYVKRNEEYRQYRSKIPSEKPAFNKRVINKLKRVLKIPTYIDQVNKKLLSEKVINEPLSEAELWSITDIHVEDLPYSTGKGISKEMLIKNLPDYRLLSYRTYAFFGTLSSNLDSVYRQKEADLVQKNDPHGRNFCSVWKKGGFN